jgi:hypothetical protein
MSRQQKSQTRQTNEGESIPPRPLEANAQSADKKYLHSRAEQFLPNEFERHAVGVRARHGAKFDRQVVTCDIEGMRGALTDSALSAPLPLQPGRRGPGSSTLIHSNLTFLNIPLSALASP